MNSKIVISLSCMLAACATAQVQQTVTQTPPLADSAIIANVVEQPEVEMHIRFLAANELAGRNVGDPGLDIAARYLAAYFRSHNLTSLPGIEGYMQQVPFQEMKAPSQGQLTIGDQSFALHEGFLARAGQNGNLQGQAVVLEYGTEEELKPEQVKGKWVIARAGKEKNSNTQAQFYASFEKQKALEEMGALGLIELYHNPGMPWSQISHYLSGTQLQLAKPGATPGPAASSFPILWVNDPNAGLHQSLQKKKQPSVALSLSGKSDRQINSPNVVALVEGSDPALKQEYVLLSAHYDHVGIGKAVAGDSIYNGARDNAIGAAALLMAAQYFAEHPPKRSILIAAWTAEEKGLLGSRWFVENSPVPLKQIMYNLNIDGAGYNDTTKVTVIGLERTDAEADLLASAQTFGLTAIQDPVPEQNLFDRSDNVHFAKAGIPAPTYSLGFTAFDAELMKYYHKPADEAEGVNYNYVTNYIRSYVLAAEKIANSQTAPFWKSGDKYEPAGKSLYNR